MTRGRRKQLTTSLPPTTEGKNPLHVTACYALPVQAIKVYGGGSVAPVIPAVLTDGFIHASGRFIRSATVPRYPLNGIMGFEEHFFF